MIFEPETLIGMRAFPETQALWAAEPLRTLGGLYAVNWYGADLREEEPAFCLVDSNASAELQDLVGELLSFTRGDRTVYLYCLATASLPSPFAVTRRAFIGLGLLTEENIDCVVGVL